MPVATTLMDLAFDPVTLARLLDMSVDAIITVDDDEQIVQWNQGAEQIFGYTPADALGQPLSMLLPEIARGAHHQHVREFADSTELARHMGHRGKITGVRSDGEEFPAEASIMRLASAGRTYLTVVLRDISERERDDAARRFLVESGAQLGSSLDYDETVGRIVQLGVPILGDVCIVDVYGGEGQPDRKWNPPALLVHPDERLSALVAADEACGRLEAGERIRSAVWVPLAAHGELFGVMRCYTRQRTLRDRDLGLAVALGQRAALALAHSRMYADAQRASRSRDEVLAVVSHDLRNPLSTIAMCADALADPVAPDMADVRSMAGIICHSADWAQRIIRDLLDATSIDAGRLSLDRRAVTADTILSASRDLFITRADAAGVAIMTRGDTTLPPIHADSERILQIMFNLLGNAMKYTKRGGTISLEATLDEARDAVRFRVTDTGDGIPSEHLPHLFDRLWQLGRAHRGGAGLGLAIAKGIVTAHGGTMGVTSIVGVGSTFTFTIPLARQTAYGG